MELNVSINTDKYCNILINDCSKYQEETNNNVNPASLKFSDTVSLISIVHQDTREDKLKYYYIDKHTSKTFKIPTTFDGIFTVNFIVIPTKEWYDRVLKSVSKEALVQAFEGKIYICDGDNIIEINQVQDEYINIEDFIASKYSDNLSVSAKTSKLLSICKLHKCYVNLCQQIFNNKNLSLCQSRNKVDSELIYKRDLIWMTINVITYLWKLSNNDTEIMRILTQVNSCNGLCDPYPNINDNGKQNGCGCSSR